MFWEALRKSRGIWYIYTYYIDPSASDIGKLMMKYIKRGQSVGKGGTEPFNEEAIIC